MSHACAHGACLAEEVVGDTCGMALRAVLLPVFTSWLRDLLPVLRRLRPILVLTSLPNARPIDRSVFLVLFASSHLVAIAHCVCVRQYGNSKQNCFVAVAHPQSQQPCNSSSSNHPIFGSPDG